MTDSSGSNTNQTLESRLKNPTSEDVSDEWIAVLCTHLHELDDAHLVETMHASVTAIAYRMVGGATGFDQFYGAIQKVLTWTLESMEEGGKSGNH